MKVFEDLASKVHVAWARCGRDESAFPEIAQSMLDGFAGSGVDPDDVFRWLVTTDNLPLQLDPQSKFGNFALTVASRDDFCIDVLVWTDSTTSIHQHGFSGAFHVLHGSSLHTLWSFQESKRWSDRLKAGQLSLCATEYLRTGSTRPILPRNEMIHSLFHLEKPSVTVVVRTLSSAVYVPQLTYERSGLAYDPHPEPPIVQKTTQLLRLLWTSNHERRLEISKLAMSTIDAYSAVRIILSLASPAVAEGQAALIEGWKHRDPGLAALLRDTIRHMQRDRFIVRLRKHTQSPRHRMLLAMILNLPDRVSIESAVRQIAPEEAPEQWLWETIRSMYVSPSDEWDDENVLGMELNESNEDVLRMLFEGHSVEEICHVLPNSDESRETVQTACLRVSESPVLASLMPQR